MDKPSGALPSNHPLRSPGLKWRKRAGASVPVWVPPAKDVKRGYIPKCLMLNPNASPIELAMTCQRQWKDLETWRNAQVKPVNLTISWLIDRYMTDNTSPFQKVGHDTEKSYRWECARIRETIGDRRLDPKMEGGLLVPRIVGEDIRRWFQGWGISKSGKAIPSRAVHCMAMFRILISYAVEIGVIGAVELRGRLSAMQFEKPAARDKAPIYDEVDAFVNKAEEMGWHSIATATLAQYELIERRTHIIGKWNDDAWADGWVWEGVSPDWIIKYWQTKKGRVLREFDLKTVQRLLGLMQLTPKDKRVGPVIICETTGQPWDKRRYQETFRKIAAAAGLGADFQSRDMRAGGATEADGVEGVSDRQLQDAGGWQDPKMPQRYRRNKQRNANNVVVMRQAARDKQ